MTALVLAAILATAQPAHVDVRAEGTRLEALASGIVDAVRDREALAAWNDAHPGLPWRGPTAPEASALALVAIAAHESGFRADVSDCRRTGDVGRSITAFQLMRGRAWGAFDRAILCRSPALAARQALAALAAQGARCATPRSWFDGYASGNCGQRTAAGGRQCAIWERLAKAAGLRASCNRHEADRAP